MLNMSKIVQIANAIRNPQQAINVLLSAMDKKNPEIANNIRHMIQSGKNPSEALKESAAKGTITLVQLNELKSAYKMAKNLGLKINIPNKIWNEVEVTLRTPISKSTPKSNNNFKGF